MIWNSSSLHAWWSSVHLMRARGGRMEKWNRTKLLVWGQFLIYSFSLTLIHQLWFGHYPTEGIGRLRGSSGTWNEVVSKHSASFIVYFHIIVSLQFNFFFILYGLIGPVGELLHGLWRAEILSRESLQMILVWLKEELLFSWAVTFKCQ